MEAKRVFIDTNVPIYASGKESPFKKISISILEDISSGKIIGLTSAEVLQEILYRFHALNILEKGIIVFDEFSNIIDEVLPVNFKIMQKAKLILSDNSKINARDAIHAATIDYYGIEYIATFDKHFSIFKQIKNYIKS